MHKFNTYSGTTTSGIDIISTLKTSLSLSDSDSFCLKKIDLICDSAIGWKINGESIFASLNEDPTDNKYKLSTDKGDIIINSMIPDTSSVDFFISFLY